MVLLISLSFHGKRTGQGPACLRALSCLAPGLSTHCGWMMWRESEDWPPSPVHTAASRGPVRTQTPEPLPPGAHPPVPGGARLCPLSARTHLRKSFLKGRQQGQPPGLVPHSRGAVQIPRGHLRGLNPGPGDMKHELGTCTCAPNPDRIEPWSRDCGMTTHHGAPLPAHTRALIQLELKTRKEKRKANS